MQILPYTPKHLENLLLQPSQEYMRPMMLKKEYQDVLNVQGKAFSAVKGGQVIACAGILPMWEGRAEAWALMNRDIKTEFIHIHRATLRFLEICGVRRVEAHIDRDFGCAVRWIEMLGFEFEGNEAKYTPDGRDTMRYARVK